MQLRIRRIDKVVLCGMSANLFVESHMRDLLEQRKVIAISLMDLEPLMQKYGITAIVDQYHSSLEHTFLWVVETTAPHNLEAFSIEPGVARWNDLKFVPERTFTDVITDVRVIHGLGDREP